MRSMIVAVASVTARSVAHGTLPLSYEPHRCTVATSTPMGSRPRQIALHPFLLAAYAVLFIYAANMRYALFSDVLLVTCIAVLGSVVVFGLCWLVFRDFGRAALVAGSIVFVFFGYRYIVSAISQDPPALLLIVIAAIVVGLATLVALRFPRYVPPINTAL